jgi:hypothetical protein
MRRTGPSIVAAAAACLALVGTASAAPVSGSLAGVKVPPQDKALSAVRAVDMESARIVDTQELTRSKFKLQIPALRPTLLFSSITPLGSRVKPVERLAAVVRVKKKGQRGLKLPARKGKPVRPKARSSVFGDVSVPHPAIWIKHFSVDGGPEGAQQLRKGLADMLITDVAQFGSCSDGTPIWVVEREKLKEALDELNRQQSKYFDPKTRAQRGKIIKHNMEITGSAVYGQDGTLTITANVKDLYGKRSGSASVSGPAANFFGLQAQLVKKLRDVICKRAPLYNVTFEGTASEYEYHVGDSGELVLDHSCDADWKLMFRVPFPRGRNELVGIGGQYHDVVTRRDTQWHFEDTHPGREFHFLQDWEGDNSDISFDWRREGTTTCANPDPSKFVFPRKGTQGGLTLTRGLDPDTPAESWDDDGSYVIKRSWQETATITPVG